MKIFGHRGAAGLVDENTIASMRKALELAVDGIEFDVRLSSDGVPVVIHDETVDRTTNGSGRVDSHSAAELDSLGIPSLVEVLKFIGTKTAVNVELKESQAARATHATIASLVEQKVLRPEQILVTSFDLSAVQAHYNFSLDEDRPAAVGLLTKGTPTKEFWSVALALGAVSVNIDLDSVDEDFMQTARERNHQVMVYTVNTLKDASRMRELGVDAIFSDFPGRVRS